LNIIGEKKDPIGASPDTHVIDFAYVGEQGVRMGSVDRAVAAVDTVVAVEVGNYSFLVFRVHHRPLWTSG
jgi:hypothetical protein